MYIPVRPHTSKVGVGAGSNRRPSTMNDDLEEGIKEEG